jgi:hypothetical protein
MEPKLAYLAHGRLFYRNNGTAELIESQYGQEVVKRALERQAKNEWKSSGTSTSALFSRGSLWGSGDDSRTVAVKISSVVPGDGDNELLYVVSTEAVGGLFKYDIATKKETRIFHKEKLWLTDLCKQSQGNLVACGKRMVNGTSRLAVINGQDVSEITEGDSVDEAPSWIPGPGKKLVFQSAGVARNQNGVMMGVGHTYIQQLDLETGSINTLLENESFDFLAPRKNEQGDLFFIRRPYESPFSKPYPVGKMLLDIVLFPFRLARAFFHYLNFFSIAFSKKPLTTASGPKVEGPDEKTLFLKGRMIDAQKFIEEQGKSNEAPSLVPKNWQLMRRSSDGKESVLADAVLSYDFDQAGNVIYSTGISVFRLDAADRNKTLLFKDKLVDTVIVLK